MRFKKTIIFQAKCPRCGKVNTRVEFHSSEKKAEEMFKARIKICKFCGETLFNFEKIQGNNFSLILTNKYLVSLENKTTASLKSFLMLDSYGKTLELNIAALIKTGFVGILRIYGWPHSEEINILLSEGKGDIYYFRDERRNVFNEEAEEVRAEE